MSIVDFEQLNGGWETPKLTGVRPTRPFYSCFTFFSFLSNSPFDGNYLLRGVPKQGNIEKSKNTFQWITPVIFFFFVLFPEKIKHVYTFFIKFASW